MIRWFAQQLFISPRAEDSLLHVPNYHVTAIAGPNLLCIFLHLVSSLPSAGEASRGYLHGGILVDFVGQKPPTSRFTLLLLDLIIMGLQCFMMTVNMEKDRIRKVVKPPPSNRDAGTEQNATGATAATTGQDHDAEERGVLRDAPTVDESHDIEMRPLGGRRLGGDDDDDRRGNSGERAGLLERSSARRAGEYDSLRDVLRSGNAVLSTFDVRQAVRTAWNNRRNTPESAAAYTIQSVGYNATLAALAAQRRARLAAAQQGQV
jgi:hypothetical protein